MHAHGLSNVLIYAPGATLWCVKLTTSLLRVRTHPE